MLGGWVIEWAGQFQFEYLCKNGQSFYIHNILILISNH